MRGRVIALPGTAVFAGQYSCQMPALMRISLFPGCVKIVDFVLQGNAFMFACMITECMICLNVFGIRSPSCEHDPQHFPFIPGCVNCATEYKGLCSTVSLLEQLNIPLMDIRRRGNNVGTYTCEHRNDHVSAAENYRTSCLFNNLLTCKTGLFPPMMLILCQLCRCSVLNWFTAQIRPLLFRMMVNVLLEGLPRLSCGMSGVTDGHRLLNTT